MELFGRMVIRLAVRYFGALGTLVVVGFAVVAIVGTFTLLGFSCFGCMGGLVALVAVDIGTATPERATVTGHHWEREVATEEAKRGSAGDIRWSAGPPIRLQGDDLYPRWPVVPDDGCQRVGCRRAGSRKGTYELVLRRSTGTIESCTVQEDEWPRFAVGSPISVEIGGILGTVYCQSSKPEAVPAPAPAPAPGKGGGRRRR